MAKDSRFEYAYRSNASRLHKTVGDFLRQHRDFCGHSSFQEYSVNKVNPSFPSGKHKFDWVVPALRLVIECHGRQHYIPTSFGGEESAKVAFRDIKLRDEAKKDAALAVGWRYIVVKYTEQKKVTSELIFDKIKEADTELMIYQLEHSKDVTETHTNVEMVDNKARSKAYRREKRRE